eukprot:2785387-Prymnesium_polylepis.1
MARCGSSSSLSTAARRPRSGPRRAHPRRRAGSSRYSRRRSTRRDSCPTSTARCRASMRRATTATAAQAPGRWGATREPTRRATRVLM